MQNIDYNEKYLKYKKKYINLKNQIGGDKCVIYNFRNYKDPSVSEVISHGDLQSQMTSHGLGSGIYGFIDPKNAKSYGNFSINSPINIDNCLKLTRQWNDDYGEKYSEFGNFQMLSIMMNELCNNIYNKKNIDIKNQLLEVGVINEKDKIHNISGLSEITLDEIIINIKLFLTDYTILMTTNPSDEHYIVMPINYLLYGKYDGIYNKIEDSGNSGSVSYVFPYKNARSFKSNKKSKILKGNLIFHEKLVK